MTTMVRYSPAQLARLLRLPEPTPEQAAVIAAPLGPLAVIAGAGSGKSETMAARLVWLVANGLAQPERMLGLTFTRKAAAELADRVRRRLDGLRRAGVEGIAAIRHYRREFVSAFGREMNDADLVRAIAAYERTLVSFDSPFDRFAAGDARAIDDAAKRGWELFNTKARCNKCHAPSESQRDSTYFTDFDYHNIGIGILAHDVAGAWRTAERELAAGTLESVDRAAIGSELSVLGRFLVTRKEADTAAFKTPGLRNVLVTAPYFHDGSQATLWDVIDHYNKGDGLKDAWLDEDMQPLALTESEIDDLVAFLASLTSAQYRALGERELARQRALAQTSRPQRDTARAFGPKPPRFKPPAP